MVCQAVEIQNVFGIRTLFIPDSFSSVSCFYLRDFLEATRAIICSSHIGRVLCEGVYGTAIALLAMDCSRREGCVTSGCGTRHRNIRLAAVVVGNHTSSAKKNTANSNPPDAGLLTAYY